jgi:hypothetical protein
MERKGWTKEVSPVQRDAGGRMQIMHETASPRSRYHADNAHISLRHYHLKLTKESQNKTPPPWLRIFEKHGTILFMKKLL